MTTPNKAQHTPGPWQTGFWSGNINGEQHTAFAVWDGERQEPSVGEPVCLIAPADDTDERDEANARLIAAAPELLAVLLEYLVGCECGHAPSCAAIHDLVPCTCHVGRAEAAIAKAEGRAE